MTRTSRGRQGTYRQPVTPATRLTRGPIRYEQLHDERLWGTGVRYDHDGALCGPGQCIDDVTGQVYWQDGLGYVRYPEEVVMYRNGNANGNRHFVQRERFIPRGGFLLQNGDYVFDHDERYGERFYGPVRSRNGREYYMEEGYRIPRNRLEREEYGWYPEANVEHGYGRVWNREEPYLIGGHEHACRSLSGHEYEEEYVAPRSRSARLRDEQGRFRPWDDR
jgi:hypothetical protein